MLPLQRTLPLRAWMVGFFTAASDSAKDAEALASAGLEMMSSQKSFRMKALRLPSGCPFCSHAVRTSIGILPIEVVVPVLLASRSFTRSFSRCFASSVVYFFFARRSMPLLQYLPPAPGRELVLSGCNRNKQIRRQQPKSQRHNKSSLTYRARRG